MSQEQLGASAGQLVEDLRNTRNAYGQRKADVQFTVSQLPLRIAELGALTARLESARDRIETAIGGGTVPTAPVALLDFSAPDNSRPEIWVNSVTNGPTFRGVGNAAGVIGGRSGSDGPFGLGLYNQAANGGPGAVTSDELIEFPGKMGIQHYLRIISDGGRMMGYSATGKDTDPIFLSQYIFLQGSGQASFRVRFKAFGFDETIDTDPVNALTIGSLGNIYQTIMQRDADNHFSFRSNGKVLARTQNAFVGTLSGHLDAVGLYDRATLAIDSFRLLVGSVLVKRDIFYTGTGDYTPSLTRPTV